MKYPFILYSQIIFKDWQSIIYLVYQKQQSFMNNNLGILNNRFHKKAIQSRKRQTSADTNTIHQMQGGKKKNEYYER
ncbi:unnamed protein product [Paramecium primaurelia]|nr:unnamed protein product [Paramecium primaurelia]